MNYWPREGRLNGSETATLVIDGSAMHPQLPNFDSTFRAASEMGVEEVVLHFGCSDFSPSDIARIMELLETCPSVTSFAIKGTAYIKQAKMIAQSIANCSHLKCFKFDCMVMPARGESCSNIASPLLQVAIELATLLKTNNVLRRFSFKDIAYDTGPIFMQALVHNSSLTHFELFAEMSNFTKITAQADLGVMSDNALKYESCSKELSDLAKAAETTLMYNIHLVSLQFGDNIFREDAQIATALKRNQQLSDLWVLLAWIARRTASISLRGVVDSMTNLRFRQAVFAFFLPMGAHKKQRKRHPLSAVPKSMKLEPCLHLEELKVIELEVIEEVLHDEDAAIVHPEEAEKIVCEQWATSIECPVQPSYYGDSDVLAVLLTFGRHPHSFDAALTRCRLAAEVIAAGGNPQPPWANGAKVLVPGLSEQIWHEINIDVKLCPYHVLVRPEDVQELDECLVQLGKQRPRLKPGKEAMHIPNPATQFLQDVSSHSSSSQKVCLSIGTVSSIDDNMPWVNTDSDIGSRSDDDDDDDDSKGTWVERLREYIRSGRRVYRPVRNTFLEFPDDVGGSPRSTYTQSAPGQSLDFCNPRIWGRLPSLES